MPASTNYSSRDLCATENGIALCGKLFTPANASRDSLPAVVCAHGFGSNYLSCVPYAWALAEIGFAVYCFDFCGGGYAAKSAGNPLEMTIQTEANDIHTAVKAVARLDEVDETRIYVLGEGQGGFAATLFTDSHPHLIDGLVLVHPTFSLHDQTRKLFPTKKNIPASYRLLGMRVGRAFGETAWDTNPYSHMQNFVGDVLILHGDEDASVPLEYSRRAAKVFPCARLQVIRHGRHVFKGVPQEQCIAEVCEFLQVIAR